MKKYYQKIRNKMYYIMASVTTMVMLSPVYVYADAFEDVARKAEAGITDTGKSLVRPLIAIMLVIIGVGLIIGGQRAKEQSKEKAPQIMIGLACVMFASALATTFFGWFK